MSNSRVNTMDDKAFDTMLKESLPAIPPEDVIREVTPWKKSMNYILMGLAMNAIRINFLCLNYILPTIGLIMCILGFRTLRKENEWFAACNIITIVHAIIYMFSFLINATVFQSLDIIIEISGWLVLINAVLILGLMFCLWRAILAVQGKAGMIKGAPALIYMMLWYGMIYVFAWLSLGGLILVGILILLYIGIISSLFRLAGELDEAGYSVLPVRVRVPDCGVTLIICTIIAVGLTGAYLFGNKYPMNWEQMEASEHVKVDDIKEKLILLGFPEDILEDLSAEDIEACEGAVSVAIEVGRYYVYDEQEGLSGNGLSITEVQDKKDLCITGIAVELEGDRDSWRIFHHFRWEDSPEFCGTEAIVMWPIYRHNSDWVSGGAVSGRVLYTENGVDYTSPYYSLEEDMKTLDVLAEFSMPDKGESHRGYLSYEIVGDNKGFVAVSMINFVHQKSRLRYPVITAMEWQLSDSWDAMDIFDRVQSKIGINE